MIRISQTCLGSLLVFCTGLAFAAPPPSQSHPAPAPAASVATPAEASSIAKAAGDVPSLQEIQTFTRAFEMIKQAYVDPVSDNQLMQAAIRGMLSGLDPHSEFLDRHALNDLNEDTSGAYSGLGIEVAQVNHQLVIIAPLDGGPAKRAGVLAEAGIPTAMLFVRNPTGISHSPAEFAEHDDCLAGIAALTDVVRELAG